jgi:hypothetical protein
MASAAATTLLRSAAPDFLFSEASASSAAALADEPLLFGLVPALEPVDFLGSTCFAHYWHDPE